jgi:hypothetical protein
LVRTRTRYPIATALRSTIGFISLTSSWGILRKCPVALGLFHISRRQGHPSRSYHRNPHPNRAKRKIRRGVDRKAALDPYRPSGLERGDAQALVNVFIDVATLPKETSEITISPGSLRGAEGGISCPSDANSANGTKRV